MTTETQKTDKWLDRKLERRALLKKAAIGGASLAVLYVAPKFTSVGSSPVFAGTPGTDGCTPGFWKTQTPSTTWPATYNGGQLWTLYFGVGLWGSVFNGMTLNQVLTATHSSSNACNVEALGRHAVAALLNAAAGIGFAYNTATVILDTNVALATSGCSLIISTHTKWVTANEAGCVSGGVTSVP